MLNLETASYCEATITSLFANSEYQNENDTDNSSEATELQSIDINSTNINNHDHQSEGKKINFAHEEYKWEKILI